MAAISTVGRRGQITLPSSVRRELGLGEGDRVAFVLAGGAMVLQRLPGTLRDLRGSVPARDSTDFRRRVRAERAERHIPRRHDG
jgi:AbrB family looped-hinge helix DNA binding protein